jgi:L-ribulose-5-phosphate 3-epimerase
MATDRLVAIFLGLVEKRKHALRKGKSDMKKYSLGLYEKALPQTLSFKEKLEAAKQCGFDFLEISIDESDEKQARLDWTKEQINELRQTCFETDMPIYTMCLSGNKRFPIGSTSKKSADKGISLIKKAVDFSAVLGIRIVQVAGWDVFYDEKSSDKTRALYLLNLKDCVNYASTKGVILALENMENDFMDTVEKAMYYVREIDSPYFQVYPDSGNISNGCSDIAKDILFGKGHIAAAHLKESKPGVHREVEFGQGHVDFDAAISTYKDIGVNMFLAEFWYDGKDDWMDKTTKVHDFLWTKISR